MKWFFTLYVFQLFSIFSFAQSGITTAPEKWDLRKCVEYAMQNNISVRQADLQIRFAELELYQTKQSLYPNANFNTNLGVNSGRNQDPTSFTLITSVFVFNNVSFQASVNS